MEAITRRGRGRPRRNRDAPTVVADGTKPVRAVAYLRVSTNDQATDGYGLDGQRNAIAQYAEAHGWSLVGQFEDAGISGTYGLDDLLEDGTSRRPGLAGAIKAIEDGDADALVVYALDRIGRAHAVFGGVWLRLDRIPATFASVTEPALSLPTIRDLMRGLYAGMAAQERTRILDRMRSGRLAKAQRGGIVGRVPYGYRIVGDSRRTRHVEVVESEADAVRLMYRLRGEGATLAAIATYLNASGVAARSPRGWHTHAVWRVLENPAYRGVLRWQEGRGPYVTTIETPGAFPIILDVA